ncbi:hypothetical protein CCACVL1_10468 [Corchorus capsularis]|uniref:Uncharacterized protein n=1 Tax=Corchorus capsularis TaxID=210143 RepID=A0A1R3IR27_COCAP|nr:hypothetical protein CCACVL1_10468 [Corchorus capsularis]
MTTKNANHALVYDSSRSWMSSQATAALNAMNRREAPQSTAV